MKKIWNGSIAPLRKHVTNVSYVGLGDMDQDAWSVLDYGALDASAAEGVNNAIVNCALAGFWVVDIDMHKAHTPHGGKPRYYYPAASSETPPGFKDRLESLANFSGYNGDNDAPTPHSDRVGELLYLLGMASPSMLREVAEDANQVLEIYEEFDNSWEIMDSLVRLLVLAIMVFRLRCYDPVTLQNVVEKLVRDLDIFADELYAVLNDDEPLE